MRLYFKQRRRKGLSLIEVIVAMAIFGLFAAVLTSTFTAAMVARQSVRQDPQREEDRRFVLRHVLSLTEKEAFEEGGELETLHSGAVSWETDYEPTEIVDLFKVFITIEFQDREIDEEPLVEELYLLRPFLSDPDERDSLIEEKREGLDPLR